MLRELETLPASFVVPGHGPVFTDFAYPRQVRVLLERAVAIADSLARAGTFRPEIERRMNLEDLKPLFVQPGDANAEAYWQAAIRRSLPDRAYRCAAGSQC